MTESALSAFEKNCGTWWEYLANIRITTSDGNVNTNQQLSALLLDVAGSIPLPYSVEIA